MLNVKWNSHQSFEKRQRYSYNNKKSHFARISLMKNRNENKKPM